MRKAYVFVRTRSQVKPERGSGLEQVLMTLLKNTVIVITPEKVGSGVLLGDTIVTSLLLVRNYPMVTVRIKDETTQAVAYSFDERNFLAKLLPVCFSNTERKRMQERVPFLSQTRKEIGHPFLVSRARKSRTSVEVGAMLYFVKTELRESKEAEIWKVDDSGTDGMLGSGIWELNGSFSGMAIGHRTLKEELLRTSTEVVESQMGKALVEPDCLLKQIKQQPRLYAVPTEAVMDYVETK